MPKRLIQIWINGVLATSLVLLAGCATTAPYTPPSISVLQSEWESAEAAYGKPNRAFTKAFIDSLKALNHTQEQLEELKTNAN